MPDTVRGSLLAARHQVDSLRKQNRQLGKKLDQLHRALAAAIRQASQAEQMTTQFMNTMTNVLRAARDAELNVVGNIR